MSIDLPLTADEVATLKRITRVEDETEAVTRALREFLRLIHLRELKAVSGKLDFQANWQELEARELGEIELPR